MDRTPLYLESSPLPDFNTSIEGDFWANAAAATNIPMDDFNPNQQQQEELFFDTQQAQPSHQQQQNAYARAAYPPPHAQSAQATTSHPSLQHASVGFPAQVHAAAPSGPPAHLFATPFSPFQHATFEVENDLNGVNPSTFLGGPAGVPQPQQSMVRGQTGESMHYTSNVQIGQMAPQPLMGQYDSLIDAEVVEATQQQQQQGGNSRKRQRGPTGAVVTAAQVAPKSHAMDLTRDSHETPRSLEDSTFTVYPGGRGGSQHGGSDTPSVVEGGDRDESKKVKHQLTDRQRRAKIKESMDALKQLVPLEPNQKADQATIVASSVTLVQNLKDEVAELRKRLQQMEMSSVKEASKLDSKRQALRTVTGQQHPAQLSNSPFTSMMASLNGAGVSMWRIGLTGKIIEVNLVFELVSGFSAAEIIGNTPCGPPLFGSLSIMPSAFLKAFSEVSAIPQINAAGEPLEHTRGAEQTTNGQSPASSSTSGSSPHPLEFPNSPHTPSTAATSSAFPGSTPGTPVNVKQELPAVNQSSTAQSSQSQASVAPLYANASISNFPVVPQTELENFFPYKCRSLIQAQTMAGVVQPQPHGNFLVNHLAALPYNHVLKLLCRHHTLWGEILESIVTLCLVRDAQGAPDYIMLLSTPDCRRLLTPATHTKSTNMPNMQVPSLPMKESLQQSMHQMDIEAALEDARAMEL